MSIFFPGDKASVVIPQENRDWGYNPCADGTIVEIVRYNTIYRGRGKGYDDPGLYENTSWCVVRDENGKEWAEWDGRLSHVDQDVAKQRPRYLDYKPKKLAELPSLEFWEDDIVEHDGEEFYIKDVNYEYIGKFCNDGVTPMSLYDLGKKENPGTVYGNRTDLKLIRRGNIWKYYNNEPLEFADIIEESDFAFKLGKATEIRNPKTGNYRWDGPDDFLPVIASGEGDCIKVSHFIGTHTSVYRFEDRELGRKIAQKTLEGFDYVA